MSTCADCACWHRVTEAFGMCRRFPPRPMTVLVEGGSQVRMFWSETQPGAWCAEHRPSPEAELALWKGNA